MGFMAAILEDGNKRPRTLMAPQRLYVRMSREFRQLRGFGHDGCSMPMVVASEPRKGGPNWRVQEMSSHCAACAKVAGRVAERFAREFDVHHAAAVDAQDAGDEDCRLFGT